MFLKKFFHPMGYFAPLRGIPYETRFDLRFHERKEVKTLEQEKFVEAVHTYGDMVYRVACHALRNPADSEDVMQTVFLKLYEHPKPFESDAHRSEERRVGKECM